MKNSKEFSSKKQVYFADGHEGSSGNDVLYDTEHGMYKHNVSLPLHNPLEASGFGRSMHKKQSNPIVIEKWVEQQYSNADRERV